MRFEISLLKVLENNVIIIINIIKPWSYAGF